VLAGEGAGLRVVTGELLHGGHVIGIVFANMIINISVSNTPRKNPKNPAPTGVIYIRKQKVIEIEMDEAVRRLAFRIKMHNIGGNVVHHAALLKKLLDLQGVGSTLVKGYCVIPETKEACEHYWVRVPDPENQENHGLDLDVAFAVAKLRNQELQALNPVLLEYLPPGLTRSDLQETMIREENVRLYELYQRDPRAFWLEAPHDVRNFRANA
jgi:hypothetical protein